MGKKRDHSAEFNAMVLRQRDLIWHVCGRYRLGSAWTTDDIFQQVLEVLWVAYPKFRKQSSERTWVYVVANRTILRIKRDLCNQPLSSVDNCDIPLAEGPDAVNLIEVMDIIDSFDEPERTILHAVGDGFSHAEIAEMVDLTEAAVTMRLKRTKEILKNLLYGR